MWTKLIALTGAALLLAGCSASSNTDVARSACISAAEEEVGAPIEANDIQAGNIDDAMFEAGITDDRKTDDDNTLFVVTGEFIYEKDGTQSRRSMLCHVGFEDGQPGEPDLTVIGGN